MKARNLLDPEPTALVDKGYRRTYKYVNNFISLRIKFLSFHSIMIRAQMLSEFEEIIQYKQYADQPERRNSMKKTWMKRLAYNYLNHTRFTDCKI